MSWTVNKMRRYQKDRYRLLVDNGLCISCKSQVHQERVRCLSCHEDMLAQQKKAYAKKFCNSPKSLTGICDASR